MNDECIRTDSLCESERFNNYSLPEINSQRNEIIIDDMREQLTMMYVYC